MVDLLLGDWFHFSLLDLLDDPGLLHYDSVDDVLFHEALRLLRGQQLQRTALRYLVRFQVCVCQHLARTINTCLAESTFVLTLVCVVLVVRRKSSRVGHPRPSLSGTGVPWVSCLDPPVCPRVQADPETKSQPGVVLVGVLRSCDGRVRVRVRVREKRVCVQLRILAPLLFWKHCSSSQSHSFSVISSVSFVPFVASVPLETCLGHADLRIKKKKTKTRIIRVLLAQGPRKNPFQSMTTFLELCASSLCRNHANANLLCISTVEEKCGLHRWALT